jgi:hypothetical protein
MYLGQEKFENGISPIVAIESFMHCTNGGA